MKPAVVYPCLLFCLLSLWLKSIPAVGHCTWTTCKPGPVSHGSIAVTVYPIQEVRLWGLSNLILQDNGSGTYQATASFCGFSTTDNGVLSVSSQNGMILKSHSGKGIPYSLWVSASGKGCWKNLGKNPVTRVPLKIRQSLQRECQAPGNLQLKAEAEPSDVDQRESGTFSDVLLLTLTPQ